MATNNDNKFSGTKVKLKQRQINLSKKPSVNWA